MNKHCEIILGKRVLNRHQPTAVTQNAGKNHSRLGICAQKGSVMMPAKKASVDKYICEQ